jgi:hypothetical protein
MSVCGERWGSPMRNKLLVCVAYHYESMRYILSFCICCKNNPAELEQTLGSICDKVSPSKYASEIHLSIRDASFSDELKRVTAKYQMRYDNVNIEYFHSPNDVNQYSSMNSFLFASCSSFVCFLNSGDLLCDSLNINEAIAALNRKNDLIVFKYITVKTDKSGRSLRKERIPRLFLAGNLQKLNYLQYTSLFLGGQPLCHQATIVNTQFHKRFPYLVLRGFISSDFYSLFMMVTQASKIEFIDTYFALFNMNGISNKYSFLSYLQASIPLLLLAATPKNAKNILIVLERSVVILLKSLLRIS